MQELPFQFGDPVVKPLFYDREELLEELYLCLAPVSRGTHQDVAIIAPRRMGKSSIFKTLQQKLEKEKLVTVYLDLSRIPPAEKIDFFCAEYLRKVFLTYNRRAGWKILENRITQIMEGMQDKTRELISSLQLGTEINEVFTVWVRFQQGIEKNKKFMLEKCLELPELLAEKTGIPCVIFWDEFQEIYNFNSDMLWYIRSIIQHHKKVAYVITGSSVRLMTEMVSNKGAAFYGHFLVRSIGAFSHSDARKFLHERIAVTSMKFTDAALDTILIKTTGIPFYLQWLGLQCYLLASVRKIKNIDEKLVKEAYADGLAHLPQLEEELQKIGGKTREILITLAFYPNFTVHQIAQHLKVHDVAVSREIQKLVSIEYLEKKTRGKYIFRDNVFQDWIIRKFSV